MNQTSNTAYDQTPGADPLLEDELAVLTYIRSRIGRIELLTDYRLMIPELIKLRQQIERAVEVKSAELKRERVPED